MLTGLSFSQIIRRPMTSYFSIGVCGIIAGFLTFLLPETLGLKPPNSFEDLDQTKLRNTHEDRVNFVPLDSSRFRKKSADERVSQSVEYCEIVLQFLSG